MASAAPIDLSTVDSITIRDCWSWNDDWTSICEHEAQTNIYVGAARNIVNYLRDPRKPDGSENTAGIHFAVDPAECWQGCSIAHRTPHNYRPHYWSLGIEHAGFTVPGGYDGPDGDAMLDVSARLHAALILNWEERHPGRKFTLQVLTPEQVIAKEVGLFTHDTATIACKLAGWPENGHYDGRYFPFDRLIPKVAAILGGGATPAPGPEEDDMARILTFFPPGSTPRADGLQPFVEVEWATGQAHGWHGVTFDGATADEALDGDLRTVDFVKLNGGRPIRDFRVDEETGAIVGFGQGGGIFRVAAAAG